MICLDRSWRPPLACRWFHFSRMALAPSWPGWQLVALSANFKLVSNFPCAHTLPPIEILQFERIYTNLFLGGSKAPGHQEHFALMEKSFEKWDVWCQWHWHWEVLCQRQLAAPSIPTLRSVLSMYSIISQSTDRHLLFSAHELAPLAKITVE